MRYSSSILLLLTVPVTCWSASKPSSINNIQVFKQQQRNNIIITTPNLLLSSTSSSLHARRHRHNQSTNNDQSLFLRGGNGIDDGTSATKRNRRFKLRSSDSSIDAGNNSNDEIVDKKEKNDSSRQNISVIIVLVSAFLNLLGFTMAGPITPALGIHFNLKVGTMFGSLTSAYPLGMLLGLFLWPQLSDRIGRKPVMAASLIGSGLGLAAQSYVIRTDGTLKIFLLSRILTGSFAGSSPVSKAYLADVGSTEGKLPQYLAARDAASTLSFILGPLFGGILFDIIKNKSKDILVASGETISKLDILRQTSSLSFVIGISSAASLIAGILVALFVKEDYDKNTTSSTKDKKQKGNQQQVSTTTIKDEVDVEAPTKFLQQELIESCPLGNKLWAGVASVCVISFLFNVGDSTFHAFFSSILKDKFHFNTSNIGWSYTVFACVSFLISTTTSSRSVKTLGPVLTCVMALSAIGTGLLGLATSAAAMSSLSAAATAAGTTTTTILCLCSAALYYIGVPLYGPTIPTMLLKCVPPNKRGTIMGLDGAINTIGRIISPLLMGTLYASYGPTTVFTLAGLLVYLSAAICILRRTIVLRGTT